MAGKPKTDEEKAEARARSNANLKPFEKGKSGNPNGRPKGASVTAALRRQLAKEAVKRGADGQPVPTGKTTADHLAEVAINRALRGDFKFYKYLVDRLEGRTPFVVTPREGDPRQELADLLGVDMDELPD